MQIDWFTLVAQVINFLILMWLLQRFLYGPIMATMQAREDKLTNQFDAAEKQEAAAREERAALEAERESLAARRDELMQEARGEAAERRRQLIQAAREETEELQGRWFAAIERERTTFLSEIQTRMGRQLVDLARRLLGDLAGQELETAIVDKFLARVDEDLHAMTAEGDLERAPDTVVVRSSFDLPEAQQEAIRKALADIPALAQASEESGTKNAGNEDEPYRLRFEQSDELICGIEVEMGHRRIAWSMRDYLNGIARELDEAIQQNGAGARRERRPYLDEESDEILPG